MYYLPIVFKMAPKILYVLTIAPLIFSKFTQASYNTTVDDFYSGMRPEEELYPCTYDEECQIWNNSKCIDAFCACPKNTDCQPIHVIKVTTLGESCNDKNVSCHIDNSHCGNDTCVCDDGFVESASKKTCLKAYRQLGKKCAENHQCLSQFCHKNFCSKQMALGEKCLSTKQCNSTIKFSHCNDGKCSCLERYIASEGKCYLVSRDLLSPCEVDVQCTKILGKSAECVEERCVCPEGYDYQSLAKRCVLNVVASSASFMWITFKMIVFVVFVIQILV